MWGQVGRLVHCIHFLSGYFACYSVVDGGKHWLTAQLLHTTAHIFHVENGSDLESISDDIPVAAHLTDTFHFLCPCATLSALVHAQKTLTLPSANTRGINEHRSRILKPIQPARCGVLPPFSLSLHVREPQSGKAKHAALRLIQPQPVTQLSKLNRE